MNTISFELNVWEYILMLFYKVHQSCYTCFIYFSSIQCNKISLSVFDLLHAINGITSLNTTSLQGDVEFTWHIFQRI